MGFGHHPKNLNHWMVKKKNLSLAIELIWIVGWRLKNFGHQNIWKGCFQYVFGKLSLRSTQGNHRQQKIQLQTTENNIAGN
jgi:hypothetical protein